LTVKGGAAVRSPAHAAAARIATGGPRQVSVTVTDPFGLRSTPAVDDVTVDDTPPTVAVTSGPNGQTFGPHSTQGVDVHRHRRRQQVKHLRLRKTKPPLPG
jgi:hypothetical protein